MQWLGAEELRWGYHAKCCGAFLSVARPDIVRHESLGRAMATVQAGDSGGVSGLADHRIDQGWLVVVGAFQVF